MMNTIIERLEEALQRWLPPRAAYKPKPSGASPPTSPDRVRCYAEAALKGACRKLAAASAGGRNDELYLAACRLGKWVHNRILPLHEVEAALLGACNSNGLIRDDGLKACNATLASGLRKAEGDELPHLENREWPPRDTQTSGADDKQNTGSHKKHGARPTQAQTLIEIATGADVKLYHTADGSGYADIDVSGHRETWTLQSRGFRRWLRRRYYEATGAAPNGEAMTAAMGVIEARAAFDGPVRPVYLRVAEHGARIYLDLCDPLWRAIEISAEGGWQIVDRPPVRFRRTPGMLPIPDPVHGGSLDELRPHFHVDDAGYVLAVSWLLAILRGRGPYPILALTGEQGTGKSLTADMLRSLLDPHTASLRSLPRDTRDLYVAAINGHVLVFDNLSGVSTEISDALCRLSTGGGFSTRALYRWR